MKLLDWLHQWEGMGQGVWPLTRSRTRPQRLRGIDRERMIHDIAKVVVETHEIAARPSHVSWLMLDAEDRILCVLPEGAIDAKAMIAGLKALPGFNRHAYPRALRTPRPARYTVWRRQLPSAPTSAAA